MLFAGCAGITREHAVTSAKTELVRRHCRLPAGYSVDVGEGVYQAELDRPLPIWEVAFYASSRHGRALYVVLVNRRTGAVFDFSDPRRSVPSRI
jgi:hypothetical protein